MALQISFDSDLGYTFDSSYWRVHTVNLFRTLNSINKVSTTLQVFANQAARDSLASEVASRNFQWEVPQGTSLSLADIYTYLKTFPELSGAIDV